MKQIIYKFLDDYVGEGAVCILKPSGPFRTWSESWELISDNGTMILWFTIKSDQIKIFRSDSLCGKIEGYLGIDPNESWKYVRDWFGEKYNMKVLSDLLKFIPPSQ